MQSQRGADFTTTKIETETIGNTKYKYTYDNYGNITCIYKVNSDNTETILYSYVYDNYNQLTTVNDYEHSEQTTYTYNQAGNITRRNRYQMNFSWVITATLENVRYVYGDSEWKDLLTTYNGQTIIYDAIGNPLSYRDGISLTWQKGRQLATLNDDTRSIAYSYDASGMRTGKAVTNSSGATTNYSYVYENGMLQKMTRGNRILEFSYDASGNPVSIKYRSSATATPVYYYYALNSRGDVIGLYNANGALSSTYEYDAYGKLLSVKTPAGIEITSETAIANLNPLRYRGYVYDNETDFYYLQTRYYDPTTCRFINADVYYDTGQGFNGLNMYAYCNNNPVLFSDPSGTKIFKCCPYGDCYYCKAEKKADVLVISNSPNGWMESSETMGEDMAKALDVDSSYVKAVRTYSFDETWTNTTASCIIVHTHGSPNGLYGYDLSYTTSSIKRLPVNNNVEFVLVTACEVGGYNNGLENMGQYISKKISPNGLVVCSTTIVSGASKSFTATNNGQWVAYQNGIQIPTNLSTTITMRDVADYWKSR